MLVVEKTVWEDGNVNYNISIQDSRYDHNYNTIFGRMKRAVTILLGKPIYYNDLYLEGEETFRKLAKDIGDLTAFHSAKMPNRKSCDSHVAAQNGEFCGRAGAYLD